MEMERVLFSESPMIVIWFYANPVIVLVTIVFAILLYSQTRRLAWLLIPIGMILPALTWIQFLPEFLSHFYPQKECYMHTTIFHSYQDWPGLFLLIALAWLYFGNKKPTTTA